MNIHRGDLNKSTKAVSNMALIIPDYRTKLPPLWSHVVPLCFRSNGSRMRISRCSTVDRVNPSVLKDTIRRRFHRGVVSHGTLAIYPDDSVSLRAHEKSCEMAAEDSGESYSLCDPLRLSVRCETNSLQIIDCLRQLAPALTTIEIVDILRNYVFTIPNVDRTSFVNCLLNMHINNL